MSEIPTYSEVEEISDAARPSASDEIRESISAEGSRQQAGVFGRAPEAQRQEADEPEAEIAPELQHAYEFAADQYGKAQEAEAIAAAMHEERLDEIAFSSPDELAADPADVADALLGTGEGRLETFLYSWAETDPVAADQWIESAQMRLAQGIAQTQNQAIEIAGQEQIAARAKAVTSFWERNKLGDSDKGKLVAAAAISTPGLLEGTPEQIKQNLEHISATTDEALRAQEAVEFERQQRAPFSEPTFADLKRNRVRQAPVVDESAVQRRMRPVQTAEAKQAERERKIQEFRDEFKQLSKPRFGRGSL